VARRKQRATHADAEATPRAGPAPIAARRVASLLTATEPRVSGRQSISDGQLVTVAALLLLLVGAAASVLRLSVRVAGGVPTGRVG
jgi:hypothetical protein